MPKDQLFTSVSLLFVLLNPFLLTIYLLDLVRTLDASVFRRVLVRAALISAVAFSVFAVSGETIFRDVLHVRFASFQLFGGVIFGVIGVRYALNGSSAIAQLRGAPEHVAGAIAMPFMIGPGTISASMLAGANLPPMLAILAILIALGLTVLGVLALKRVHDHAQLRFTGLVERYVDVVGRASALLIGTIAVDMILNGIELWQK